MLVQGAGQVAAAKGSGKLEDLIYTNNTWEIS